MLLKGSKLIAIVNVVSRTVVVIRLFFYSLLSWIHSPGVDWEIVSYQISRRPRYFGFLGSPTVLRLGTST